LRRITIQKFFTESIGIDCRLVNRNGKIFYNNPTYFELFQNILMHF
jgi:hypothetical protein